MPSCCAVCGSCTIVIPPPALISFSPSVPSVPVPDRMTPIAFSCWSSANERRKKSTAIRRLRGAVGGLSRKVRSRMLRYAFGGIT